MNEQLKSFIRTAGMRVEGGHKKTRPDKSDRVPCENTILLVHRTALGFAISKAFTSLARFGPCGAALLC